MATPYGTTVYESAGPSGEEITVVRKPSTADLEGTADILSHASSMASRGAALLDRNLNTPIEDAGMELTEPGLAIDLFQQTFVAYIYITSLLDSSFSGGASFTFLSPNSAEDIFVEEIYKTFGYDTEVLHLQIVESKEPDISHGEITILREAELTSYSVQDSAAVETYYPEVERAPLNISTSNLGSAFNDVSVGYSGEEKQGIDSKFSRQDSEVPEEVALENLHKRSSDMAKMFNVNIRRDSFIKKASAGGLTSQNFDAMGVFGRGGA